MGFRSRSVSLTPSCPGSSGPSPGLVQFNPLVLYHSFRRPHRLGHLKTGKNGGGHESSWLLHNIKASDHEPPAQSHRSSTCSQSRSPRAAATSVIRSRYSSSCQFFETSAYATIITFLELMPSIIRKLANSSPGHLSSFPP